VTNSVVLKGSHNLAPGFKPRPQSRFRNPEGLRDHPSAFAFGQQFHGQFELRGPVSF
jgi:hypothetical protein